MDLQIQPVPGQRPTQGGHQQEDSYLRKEGEIGSGLARQSARSVAAANSQRQTPGASLAPLERYGWRTIPETSPRMIAGAGMLLSAT